MTKNEAIYSALGSLMAACSYDGESGTEKFFRVLEQAVAKVASEWDVVEQSHEDGLCYNVNALLADAIEEASQQQPSGT